MLDSDCAAAMFCVNGFCQEGAGTCMQEIIVP
jgi:hypothetical protein